MAIFRGIFSKNNDNGTINRRKQSLFSTFAENVFNDEFFVFYTVLKKVPRLISLNSKFLTTYMHARASELQREKNIDTSRFAASGDAWEEFCVSAVGVLEQCIESNQMNDSDYILALEQYRMEYINRESIKLVQDGATIMTDGLRTGRKTLQGFESMQSYVKQGLSRLDSLSDNSHYAGMVILGDDDDTEQEEKQEFICKYGVPTLDKTFGGISETEMISIVGVAKAGKSRFSAQLIHTALMQGINCVVWSTENGMHGFKSILRARHFEYIHNSGVANDKYTAINSEMIRRGTLEGKLKDMEAATYIDLKKNTNYGKLLQLDRPFRASTLFDTLDEAIKKVDAKLILVDYLGLIVDDTHMKNRNDCIASVYIEMKQFLKDHKIAGIFPAQFVREVASSTSGMSKKDLATTELRDSVGLSYEIVKTPDVNIALIASTEDIANGRVTLVSMPSRNAPTFQPVELSANFKAATFREVEGN